MTYGVDYAWGWPDSPAAIARFVRALQLAGVQFAFRYLSTDSSKNLSLGEARALSDAGISIGVVWETTATRSSQGYGAGRQDAQAAVLQAEACGMPGDRPIYFAVDYDAPPPDVEQYFHGVVSVLGASRSGVYGGYYVVKRLLDAGLVHWGWQAPAWSAGQWDARAHVRQGGQVTIGGVDCDRNTAMASDFGQWRVGQSPQQQPPPAQEDDMPYGQLSEGPKAITPISFDKGRFKQISFVADNGLQNLSPAELRVGVLHVNGTWGVEIVSVDGHKGQAVVVFPDAPNTVGISVRREDAGDVHVAYAVS